MSQIRLYLDEDAMDADVVESLRLRHINLITVAEAGMLSRHDEEQLRWALDNDRVIYSFNTKDFYRLHTMWISQGQEHAGIILGQQNYSIGEQVRRLFRLIVMKSAQEMRNQVEFLSAWGEE